MHLDLIVYVFMHLFSHLFNCAKAKSSLLNEETMNKSTTTIAEDYRGEFISLFIYLIIHLFYLFIYLCKGTKFPISQKRQ